MRRWAPLKTAAAVLVVALGVVAAMHLLILLGVLPATAVWGGAAASDGDRLLLLESVALAVTLAFMGIVAVRAGWTRLNPRRVWVVVGAWLLFAYLLLNTVGNLAAGGLERWLFVPLTIVLALLALRLALGDPAEVE